jgi:fucose permease
MQTTPTSAKFSFIILTVLFFIWGLLTSLNDILVPHLKAVFDLKHGVSPAMIRLFSVDDPYC